MATVPVYDQPQVSPNVGQMTPFQAPGVEPARDFTGKQIEEAGQAQTNLGANLMRIAEKQREIEEQSVLDKSELDLRDFIVKFQKENSERFGERAENITADFTSGYYKKVDEYIKKFGGDQQSRLVKRFQNKANEIGLATIAKYSTFEADQKQQVRVNNNKALGKMLSNTASNSPFSIKDGKIYDGIEFENSKKNLLDNLKKRAELLGYGENSDVYKQLEQEELSTVYMDRMVNIINTNPTAAPAYFEQIKGFIINDEFKSKFQGMAVKVAQEAEAEGWVETQFTDALKKKDGKQAIANLRLEIMKKFSGDTQKTALLVYDQLEKSLIEQNEAIRTKYSKEAWDVVLNSETSWGNVPNTTKEWLRQNDDDTYRSIQLFIKQNINQKRLDAERAEAKLKEQRREAKEIAREAREEKQAAAFYDLNTQMSTNPKAFMAMDLNNWRTRLSAEDFRYFVKKQSDFNLNPKEEKQSTTLSSRIETEAKILGIDKNKSKSARFTKIINADVDTFITNNNGRYPDAKQLSSIIKEAQKEYVTSEFLGIKSKARRFELEKAKTIKDIPPNLLDELRQSLAAKKIQATDAEIVNIYNTYVGQND